MFFDMGSAWDKERDYVAFTRDENGNLVSRDLLMGMGTGARIFFLAFLVRFDIAWAWDVHPFSAAQVLLLVRHRFLEPETEVSGDRARIERSRDCISDVSEHCAALAARAGQGSGDEVRTHTRLAMRFNSAATSP